MKLNMEPMSKHLTPRLRCGFESLDFDIDLITIW